MGAASLGVAVLTIVLVLCTSLLLLSMAALNATGAPMAFVFLLAAPACLFASFSGLCLGALGLVMQTRDDRFAAFGVARNGLILLGLIILFFAF